MCVPTHMDATSPPTHRGSVAFTKPKREKKKTNVFKCIRIWRNEWKLFYYYFFLKQSRYACMTLIIKTEMSLGFYKWTVVFYFLGLFSWAKTKPAQLIYIKLFVLRELCVKEMCRSDVFCRDAACTDVWVGGELVCFYCLHTVQSFCFVSAWHDF